VIDDEEARYDIFEEEIVHYISTSVFIDKILISNLNWRKMLQTLKDDLGFSYE